MKNSPGNNPSGLYSDCLNYLCNNLDLVCHLKTCEFISSSQTAKSSAFHQQLLINSDSSKKSTPNTSTFYIKKYEFKDKNIKFNHIISEDLLNRLCELGKLNDSTLALFTNTQTCLKSVHIKNATLSKESIKLLLKQHQITELVINNIQLSSGLFADCEANNNSNLANLNSQHQNLALVSQQVQLASSATSICINDLIEGLNEWSLEHLKLLNVARNSTLFGSIIINLKQLSNLTKLNVSFTCFNNCSLDIIAQDLHNLEYLDVSATRVSDLNPLLCLKHKLKHLYMYNMRSALNDDIVQVICKLGSLQSLDLSCDVSTKIFADMNLSIFDANLLLDELSQARLNDLKYLDISGKASIKQDSLILFLMTYPELKFIGLALTNACSFEIFVKESAIVAKTANQIHTSSSSPSLSTLTFTNKDNQNIDAFKNDQLLVKLQENHAKDIFQTQFEHIKKNIIVTGEATESQLIASLKHYKTRHNYIQKALYHLFELSRNYQETRIDLLQLIIELMHIHIKSQSVQLTATTCVYNLTKQNLCINIPNSLLTNTVNTILTVMQNYPNSIVLQKNCLFILCNEHILTKVYFHRFECIKATLDCLIVYNDPTITNLAISVCSKVAFKADKKCKKQTKKLTETKYLQKLLNILTLRIQNLTNDITLHCILDILKFLSEINLEDSSEWCVNFVTQNGLNLYGQLIEVYENDSEILVKAMGFIYNLSEMPQLRPILFNHPIVNIIKNLLLSTEVKLSFLAVGFFVNLLAFMPDTNWDWRDSIATATKLSEFRQQIEDIIDNWGQDLHIEIQFSHNSLDSLMKLINLTYEPIVQMWSIWAIYNMCQLNCGGNCESLSNENVNIIKLIKSVMNNQNTLPKVSKLCSFVLQIFQNSKIIQ